MQVWRANEEKVQFEFLVISARYSRIAFQPETRGYFSVRRAIRGTAGLESRQSSVVVATSVPDPTLPDLCESKKSPGRSQSQKTKAVTPRSRQRYTIGRSVGANFTPTVYRREAVLGVLACKPAAGSGRNFVCSPIEGEGSHKSRSVASRRLQAAINMAYNSASKLACA
jgi:hypothetical protein